MDTKTINAEKLRASLRTVLDDVQAGRASYTITRNLLPVAVISPVVQAWEWRQRNGMFFDEPMLWQGDHPRAYVKRHEDRGYDVFTQDGQRIRAPGNIDIVTAQDIAEQAVGAVFA